MHFSINALDGSAARLATRLAFSDGEGITATVVVDATAAGLVWSEAGVTSVPLTDRSQAAELIAGLLHRHRDHSLIVYPGGGYTVRGDEERAADVYPPGRQPRIIIA